MAGNTLKQSTRLSAPKRGLGAGFFHSKKVVPYVFASPFILFFLIFFLYPICYTGYMSLYSVKGFAPPQFSGFGNYALLRNDYFIKAVAISGRYTFWTCLILIPVPLVLASVLNSGSVKRANAMKSALFIPALTSVVMAGLFYRYAFSANENAVFNVILQQIGLPKQD
ncbi:MAG: arabinose transporter permease, partial [Clostridia bacterium]|nr:arabinose transporter permease [Clostridia bacterium]